MYRGLLREFIMRAQFITSYWSACTYRVKMKSKTKIDISSFNIYAGPQDLFTMIVVHLAFTVEMHIDS